MTTGLKNAAGTDLDSLLEPIGSFTPVANVGYKTSDGVDLSQRFAGVAYGSAASATGFKNSAGTDLGSVFAAIGTTAHLVSPLDGGAASNFGTSSPVDAYLTFATNGVITLTNDPDQNWYTPTTTGIGSSYSIRATLDSGDTPSGTLGSWLTLNTNRTWSFSVSTPPIVEIKSCSLTIEIALTSDTSTVLSSGTYTIYAEVDES